MNLAEKAKVVRVDPELRKAMDQILDATDQDVPKLPEPLFIKHLLPVLTDLSGKANLSVWLDIAGSYQRPIDVIGPTGAVLFRVPALIGTIPTNTQRDPHYGFWEVMRNYQNHNNVLPQMGRQFLDEALPRLVHRGQVNIEEAYQWNAILKRYNLPQLPLDLPARSDAATSSAVGDSEMFTGEFDEL